MPRSRTCFDGTTLSEHTDSGLLGIRCWWRAGTHHNASVLSVFSCNRFDFIHYDTSLIHAATWSSKAWVAVGAQNPWIMILTFCSGRDVARLWLSVCLLVACWRVPTHNNHAHGSQNLLIPAILNWPITIKFGRWNSTSTQGDWIFPNPRIGLGWAVFFVPTNTV